MVTPHRSSSFPVLHQSSVFLEGFSGHVVLRLHVPHVVNRFLPLPTAVVPTFTSQTPVHTSMKPLDLVLYCATRAVFRFGPNPAEAE